MSDKITTIAELKKELTKLKKEYSKLVKWFEKNGLENIDYESVEYYGAYLGKKEMCEYLLEKIGK
jgi:hypothetical protein